LQHGASYSTKQNASKREQLQTFTGAKPAAENGNYIYAGKNFSPTMIPFNNSRKLSADSHYSPAHPLVVIPEWSCRTTRFSTLQTWDFS